MSSTPVFLTCLLVLPYIHSSRILLMPFPFKSHVTEYKIIGEGLIELGHEVHMVLPSHFKGIEAYKNSANNIPVIEYVAKYPDFLSWPDAENDELYEMALDVTIIEDFRNYYEGIVDICYNVLESEDLDSEIRALKFDLMIVDAFPCTRCFLVLAYRLDIPYVSQTTQYEPWLYRAPALPSFVPFPFHTPQLTPKMNFWERLSNTWVLLDWSARTAEFTYLTDEFVTKYAPEKPAVSLNHLASQSLLWLFGTDISIDFPRPMMPNEINIGGLSAKAAKPLPQDLEKFVSSAKGGVVIVSFGSSSAIPQRYLVKMVESFKLLPTDIHVIMKWPYADKPAVVADNIYLMDWVPQADILGHNNTKLFITHCGANSQFEGLYHGVPMINIPAYGDQHYNAKRGDYHGFSETLPVKLFTPQQLYDTIMKILNSPSYRENIQRASSVFRSQPQTPQERAAFWVDHVLKYGGQHLHAHALDMPAYQYLMLDILAFVMLIFCTAILLLCGTCSIMLKSCRSKSTKLKKN